MGYINELYSEYRDLVGLGKQLGELGAKPGSSFSWHGFVLGRSGSFADFIPLIVVTTSVLAISVRYGFSFIVAEVPKMPSSRQYPICA